MPHVLIVDDDANSLAGLRELVVAEGFTTSTAATLKDARIMLCHQRPDVVLIDLMLPDGNGTELFKDLEGRENMEVILVTGHASIETAVEALRLGASDYLVKPVNIKRLKAILSRVPGNEELKAEIGSLRDQLRELGKFGKIVGASSAMQSLYNQLARVAPTSANVFLIGESGTGKELAAQTVHELSRRHRSTFLPVNCGAISPHLIESEIFGHEKGSFTGADRQHKGYFERATGGTLFLDEITEMPIEMQVKLLRVLETGMFNRIGSDRQIETDIRLIAATNRDPEAAVSEGKLREDLFHRLNVFPVLLPPLRDRQEDVILLATRFLEDLNRQENTHKVFSREVAESLKAYDWPGNVRELKNFVQRAFILSDTIIDTQRTPSTRQRDLALAASVAEQSEPPLQTPNISAEKEIGISSSEKLELQIPIGTSLAEVVKQTVLTTLDHCGGVKKTTADMLGISLKTLYNRLVEYGLKPAADREASSDQS